MMQEDKKTKAAARTPGEGEASASEKKSFFRRLPLKDYILYAAIAVGGVILDLLTKAIAEATRKGQEPWVWIDGFLQMNYTENDGIAFGMLGGGGGGRVLFMLASTVMILGIGLWLFSGHAPNKFYGISGAMILTGGVGNMIERIFKGYVVDFIDVTLYYPAKGSFSSYDFPIFNVADCFVTVGAILMMICLIVDIIAEAKKGKKGGDHAAEKDPHEDEAP